MSPLSALRPGHWIAIGLIAVLVGSGALSKGFGLLGGDTSKAQRLTTCLDHHGISATSLATRGRQPGGAAGRCARRRSGRQARQAETARGARGHGVRPEGRALVERRREPAAMLSGQGVIRSQLGEDRDHHAAQLVLAA